jgi:quercetin dioxygenase-like cupin family protein
MKRLISIVAVLGVLTAAGAAALAADTPAIRGKVLGAASVPNGYAIDVKKPADVVVAQATVPPGGSFGWHSHRSAAAVVVKSGTLTLYDSADKACTPQRYSSGKGFVEQRNHVHLARNEGDRPVVVLVTYLGLKHGVNPDVPAKSPGNCPF